MKKILVVDDEKAILEMLKAFLTQEGFAILTAENYEEALKQLEKESVDLVITDILLGKKTGIDLLQQVKEAQMHIPVVMITGQPAIDTAAESVRLGAFDYVPKPVKLEKLRHLVSKAMEHKALIDTKQKLEKENEQYRQHLEELVKQRTAELQRYEKIVSASREDMCFVDTDFMHLAVNDSYLASNKRSRAEIMELSVKDLLDEKVFEKYVRPKLERCLEGEVVQYQGWYDFPGKGKRYRHVSYYPYMESDGTISGIFINSRDLTEQKAAEEELKIKERQLIQTDKLSSMGTLVSGMTNEINTPARAILTNADLLGNLWTEVRPFMEKSGGFSRDLLKRVKEQSPLMVREIREAAKKIERLVRQLEEFACPDTSDAFVPIDINSVVKSSVALVSENIRSVTRKFDVGYYSDLLLVRGNYQRLEQVFINVLFNACEALNDSGQGIFVEISADFMENRAVVAIRDEGAGMTSEEVKRVFDPFFTTKREKGGVGMGLSVSHGIIQNHGGTMLFESEKDKGTTCIISLPLD